MKKKHWINDYLGLSRRERTGVLVVAFLVALFFLLPSLLSTAPRTARPGPADSTWILAMKKLEQPVTERETYGNARTRSAPVPGGFGKTRSTGTLFYFDPNELDMSGWQQLGLREKTIKTILNYTSKGGRFRKPDDFKRIYGLFPDEYERLRPWIRIAGNTSGTSGETVYPAAEKREYTPVRKTVSEIDINMADSSAWMALPGIGSKLSARIILFREKLGGFYSVNQVAETFGLADSVFQKIKPLLRLGQPAIKKININTVEADELKKHPYLKWAIANTLIAYRKEHGPFKRLEEIKKVQAFTEELFTKIAPYLVVQ